MKHKRAIETEELLQLIREQKEELELYRTKIDMALSTPAVELKPYEPYEPYEPYSS